MKVRTRIAPSPTGYPHIGTIYQVLFDYAFAKKNKGSFICRIEDTDRARYVQGAEEVIYDSMDWFGLTPDESPKTGGNYGPYRQSERLEIYQKYAQELIKLNHAYYCFCTRERLEKVRNEMIQQKKPPMYDRLCHNLSKEEIAKNLADKVPYVIRMKIPRDRTIVFDDLIAGKISFDSNVLDDQVIIKSDGFPTYHLAVVVDDHLMEITHILRGKEWISSTPKHILLYEFFGWHTPIHAHLPLLLNADGKGKLSKRHGHASVDFYKEQGYLPKAILNYLSNIVWAHPEGKEIYPLEEFIQFLDLAKISPSGARFDLSKLEWMNGEYLRQLPVANYELHVKNYLSAFSPALIKRHPELLSNSILEQTIPLVQTRIKKLSEYWTMCSFFFEPPTQYEIAIHKDWLQSSMKEMETISTWNHEKLLLVNSQIAQTLNVSRSKLFMDIRIAITGKKIGPPLFESMELLGKKESIARLKRL